MVKFRNAKYCNLKLFLIFLVVYGHLIEADILYSEIVLIQYKLIYFIHMPLFAFLSGLFINNTCDCKKQLLRIFPLYILFQSVMLIMNKGNVKLFTPYWHLWYLLSFSTWLCIAWVWFKFFNKRKYIFLFASVVIGCLSGYIPCIGREFSLSRTIVFFPYFFVGLIVKSDFSYNRFRRVGVISLLVAFVMILLFWNVIPTDFLYHSYPYGNVKNGPLLRLVCYFIAGAIGLFILYAMPDKRFCFTKIGVNTMPVYLLHIPIVVLIRKFGLPWQLSFPLTVLILYSVYNITVWKSKLYGIKSTEGGKPFGVFPTSL